MAAPQKPKETYVVLIKEAICSSERGELSLSDIYDWMSNTHPFFDPQETGWKNSVRHTLSLNPAFQNVPRPFPMAGKGGLWRLDPSAPDAFTRKRERQKRSSKIEGGSVAMASLDTLSTFPSQAAKKARQEVGEEAAGPGPGPAASSAGAGPSSTSSVHTNQHGDDRAPPRDAQSTPRELEASVLRMPPPSSLQRSISYQSEPYSSSSSSSTSFGDHPSSYSYPAYRPYDSVERPQEPGSSEADLASQPEGSRYQSGPNFPPAMQVAYELIYRLPSSLPGPALPTSVFSSTHLHSPPRSIHPRSYSNPHESVHSSSSHYSRLSPGSSSAPLSSHPQFQPYHQQLLQSHTLSHQHHPYYSSQSPPPSRFPSYPASPDLISYGRSSAHSAPSRPSTNDPLPSYHRPSSSGWTSAYHTSSHLAPMASALEDRPSSPPLNSSQPRIHAFHRDRFEAEGDEEERRETGIRGGSERSGLKEELEEDGGGEWGEPARPGRVNLGITALIKKEEQDHHPPHTLGQEWASG